MATPPNGTISIGDPAPAFELPDTEGRRHALRAHAPGTGSNGAEGEAPRATVVVFTCNHCPYALAWQDRIAAAARDYAGQGVRFLAINSNDAARYPKDSFDAMRERVRREHWPLPYLHDESQEVARAWGAKVTPDVFVLDSEGRLRYRGAPDADYTDPSQNAGWLRDALDAVVGGAAPGQAETEPVGCSIKWKAG